MPAMGAPRLGDRVVLDPSIPFSVHTTEGEPLTIRTRRPQAAAFGPSDPALAGYVIVDFDAFDAWYEEDERNVAHPRDPFHRIDIVHSSRHVRVELDGEVLADSSGPYLLFEPPLPVRYYLPAEDVRTDLLQPSDTRTFCAYKGQASYWSLAGAPDLAWSYPRAAARGGGDHRPRRVLQRARRHRGRRHAAGAPDHALVAARLAPPSPAWALGFGGLACAAPLT